MAKSACVEERRRWENDIKMDPKEIGFEDGTLVEQSSVRLSDSQSRELYSVCKVNCRKKILSVRRG